MLKSLALMVAICTCLACHAQDLRGTDEAKAACGSFSPPDSVTAPTPAKATGDATIYVIQISNVSGSCLGGCGPKSRIGMDRHWVGLTKGRSVVTLNVKPGLHHLCAAWTSRNKQLAELVALHSIRAEANMSYYFGLDVIDSSTLGGGWVHYALHPLDEDEAKMLINVYPISENH